MTLHRRKSKYEREGYNAYKAGEPKVANPYVNGNNPESGWRAKQWRLGWIAAETINNAMADEGPLIGGRYERNRIC